MGHVLARDPVNILGSCHCGTVQFTLAWPDATPRVPARACGCSFCIKHGGVWTSHPAATLLVTITDPTRVRCYRFGTKTADFHVCTACGVVPLVTCEIDGRRYAVVSVNAFDDLDPTLLDRRLADFDGEGTDERLARRRRNWIATVEFRTP
jgi:hypothetical protein